MVVISQIKVSLKRHSGLLCPPPTGGRHIVFGSVIVVVVGAVICMILVNTISFEAF